jgi:hypothetical protein
MPPTGATAETGAARTLPPTCEIRDWVVFAPGYWRGGLYTHDDSRRMAENFPRCREWVDPSVKLGHDRNQGLIERLRRSLGFLSLGDVRAVTLRPYGRVAVTLTNVPTLLGGLVNANRIKSGSVELIPFGRDPRDQSRQIPGPILTAVSLLGEEHPAVKGLGRIPRAVFADGSPVPANHDVAPWLEAMAAEHLAQGFSDRPPEQATFRVRVGGRDYEYPVTTVAFSEYTPMIDRAFLEKLGLSPDQIEQILAKEAGGGPGAGPIPGMPGGDAGAVPPPGADAALPPPPPGGDAGAMPPPPPPGGDAGAIPPVAGDKPKNLSQDDQTMMSELVRRVGSLETKAKADAAKAQAATVQAYAERVDAFLSTDEVCRRVTPNSREAIRKMGIAALAAPATTAFSDAAANPEVAFGNFKAFVLAIPESTKFSAHVGAPTARTPARAGQTERGRRVLEAMKHVAPSSYERLTSPTQPAAGAAR